MSHYPFAPFLQFRDTWMGDGGNKVLINEKCHQRVHERKKVWKPQFKVVQFCLLLITQILGLPMFLSFYLITLTFIVVILYCCPKSKRHAKSAFF